MTIPSNLTLLEAYPATQTTRSKTRLNPLAGTLKDNPTEEETVIRAAQQPSRIKQPLKTAEAKKVETKKTAQKNTKKKPAAVAPIHKMVVPYTT